MVNVCEKLPYIAFQNPRGTGVITAHAIGKRTKTVHRAMRPLSYATRIRIRDKGTVKKWIEYAVDGVMEEPVTHGCLVNVAWFWIGDTKRMISSMTVAPLRELMVE